LVANVSDQFKNQFNILTNLEINLETILVINNF